MHISFTEILPFKVEIIEIEPLIKTLSRGIEMYVRTAEEQKKQSEQLEKLTMKFQLLINVGGEFFDKNDNLLENAHQIAQAVLKGAQVQLSINQPAMVLKAIPTRILKPCIKNLIQITLPATKETVIVFKCNNDVEHQLAQLDTENEEEIIPFLNGITINLTKYNIPSFNKATTLHTLYTPPTLTKKQVNVILDVAKRLNKNNDFYILLGDEISLVYNMPMNILNILGENVLSLSALSLLEVIMVYATNSSAVYRQKNDCVKSFKIPLEFFSNSDFHFNQSKEDIIKNLEALLEIGLIDDYICEDDNFIIDSHLIVKQIKQYSYKQHIGFYRGLELKQQEYVYTFINYVNWIKNLNYFKKDNETGKYTTYRAEVLTIPLSSLLYNLDLVKYKSDHIALAKMLTNCLRAGIKCDLLQYQGLDEIAPSVVNNLLHHRDNFREVFVLKAYKKK